MPRFLFVRIAAAFALILMCAPSSFAQLVTLTNNGDIQFERPATPTSFFISGTLTLPDDVIIDTFNLDLLYNGNGNQLTVLVAQDFLDYFQTATAGQDFTGNILEITADSTTPTGQFMFADVPPSMMLSQLEFNFLDGNDNSIQELENFSADVSAPANVPEMSSLWLSVAALPYIYLLVSARVRQTVAVQSR